MIESGATMNEPSGDGPRIDRDLGTAQTTGRYIVVFSEAGTETASSVLENVAGLSAVADSRDFDDQAIDRATAAGADGQVYAELGMAVVSVHPDQLARLSASEGAPGRIESVVPELIHRALPADGYLDGYRDGVNDLADRLGSDEGRSMAAGAGPAASFADDDEATWGIHATRALGSSASGKDILVAVLDTGMDLAHPDFVGRSITSKSFIAGQEVQDGHGHGTHCIGTACGPKAPNGTRRYGVAYESDIFVGKVLSDEGSGDDGGILAGINWAVANGCPIISMSLGANVPRPHPPYNVAGRRSLRKGTLIIAAAGNNASRPSDPGFVGAPANSPDILAVGALDSTLKVAPFSARTLAKRGGQVDIAGPGVAVYSTWPMPTRYHTISGTSMATPHVAGLAALWAEVTGHRGLELWATLVKESQRLARPSVDVGAGLALARR